MAQQDSNYPMSSALGSKPPPAGFSPPPLTTQPGSGGYASPAGYVPGSYAPPPGPGQHQLATSYPPPHGQAPPVNFPNQAPAPIYEPPSNFPNNSTPPGLEYLTMVDQLIVKQKVELLEVFTGFETNNKYVVSNNMGQQVYYAVEENDCCTRNCLGSLRSFDMTIMDNHRMEIMKIHRPFRCTGCCCPCFLQEIQISTPSGQSLGTVEQNWSIFIPKFTIKNAAGEKVLHIEGPFCQFSCCGSDVTFDVLSLDKKHKVGKIAKKWSGLGREMFTDADTFGVTFPVDLDVNIKAVLLAATFLIDFMFFEDTDRNNNN